MVSSCLKDDYFAITLQQNVKNCALAALAVVSAASAQSSVTISGNLDLAATSINYKGNTVGTAAAANGSSTSALFFKGEEDIGGGIKAVFQYEIDPDFSQTQGKTAGTSATGSVSDVTTSLGNGQSFVGLNTNFGNVKLGTPNLATLDINGLGNSGFGTAIGSGYRVSSFDAVRLQNSAKLESAVYSGFSASVLAVAKNNAQVAGAATGNAVGQVNGRDGALEIGLKYANGPIAISYANLQVTQDAAYATAASVGVGTGITRNANNGKFTLNSLAASYAFTPEASAALFYQSLSSSNLIRPYAAATYYYGNTGSGAQSFDRSTYGISGSYLVTPVIKVMANYAQTTTGANELNTGAVALTNTLANAKTKVLGLGADYSLSKRTALYIRYERDQDGANLRSVAGYSAVAGVTSAYTATAVGIRHAF